MNPLHEQGGNPYMYREVILTFTERLTLLVQGGNLLLVQESNSYSVGY